MNYNFITYESGTLTTLTIVLSLQVIVMKMSCPPCSVPLLLSLSLLSECLIFPFSFIKIRLYYTNKVPLRLS